MPKFLKSSKTVYLTSMVIDAGLVCRHAHVPRHTYFCAVVCRVLREFQNLGTDFDYIKFSTKNRVADPKKLMFNYLISL